MYKLTVQHDTQEYHIPIEVVYRCYECCDKLRVMKYIGLGSYFEIPCPFCNYLDEDGFRI